MSDAVAHCAEMWGILAPYEKYKSDLVLELHHILTEPVCPKAIVRFERPEFSGVNVLSIVVADTAEQAITQAIDEAQTKLRELLRKGEQP